MRIVSSWIAIGAVAVLATEARAGTCPPHDPACHLAKGKELLASDPARAAEELLASYQLDERTDTLALYAEALARARRYAHALETWQRVIVFREAEVEAAREQQRKASARRKLAARAELARVQRQAEQAAEAIIALWPKVARVRVQVPPGARIRVSRGGVEVDVARDVLINAGRDELVFTREDGTTDRVTVELAGGASGAVAAPAPRIATRARPRDPEPVEKPTRAEPPPNAPAEATPVAATRTITETEPRSRGMARVGLGLVATGIALGGVAGGLAYLADRDYDRALATGCSADGLCPVGPAADLALRSNDRARLAQLAAIGGGAMLATGAALWIVGRGHRAGTAKTRRERPAVTLQVGPSSAAIGWRF
jgi:hypothetical protein